MFENIRLLIENMRLFKREIDSLKLQFKNFMHIELLLNSPLIISFATTLKFYYLRYLLRSSHQMCSVKISVLKNLTIFMGKDLCWSLFLMNLQSFRPATSLKGLKHSCFPVNVAKILRTPILKNICRQLILLLAF